MYFAKDILEEKYLYKFREIAKEPSDQTKPDKKKLYYIERIFTHNELYFPSPIDLNDPLECRPLVTLGDISDQQYRNKYVSYAKRIMIAGGNTADPNKITAWLEKHTQEKAQDFCNQMTEAIRLDMAKYRICSFSAVNNNPLLWSHYSDSHQGFCLIFDADNEIFGDAVRVKYQDKYPSYDFTEEYEFKVMDNSGLVKFSDWSYEKEFRLVSSEPNFNGALPVENNIWSFPEGMLKGVILGYKISDPDRNMIETWCHNYPRDLYLKKATLHNDKFYLHIIDA